MNFTYMDNKKLKAAIDKAVDHVQQAQAALAPYLEPMTEAERKSLRIRPPAS